MCRVLVIDDDPSVTRLLEEHLSNEGHEVSSVHLAEEGFQRAVEDPPELIFLDVMLPDATGFQMVGRFRNNSITRSIPIIMMTGAAGNPNQREIGKAMGASDYILKPFNVADISEQVHRLVGVKGEVRVSDLPPLATVPDAFTSEVEYPREIVSGDPILKEEPLPSPVAKSSPLPEIRPETIQVLSAANNFQAPAEEAQAEEAPARSTGLEVAAAMVGIQIVLAAIAADPAISPLRAATFAAGGWALMLGLMVAACAVLRVTLESREAMRILGWAAIPIVVRSAANLFHLIARPDGITALTFWLRPLDIFEMAATVILGLSVRRLKGGSLAKSLIATLVLAIAWSLTSRGYFRPF